MITPRQQLWVDAGVVAVIAIIVGLLMYGLGSLLLPFVIACFVAYVLLPLVERLERRGLTRKAAVVALYGGFAIVLAGTLVLIVPVVGRELSVLRQKLPQYSDKAQTRLQALQQDFEAKFPEFEQANLAESITKKATDTVASALQQLPELLLNLFTLASIFVLIPLITWYLLIESRNIKKGVLEAVPNRHFESVLNLLHRVDLNLSNYLAGQVAESLLVGTMSAVGYSLIGVPFGMVIGIVAGVINIIPYVGFIVGMVVAAAVTVLDIGFTSTLLHVVLVGLSVHIVDAFVIQPTILSRTANLHPLTVLMVLLIGGHLFGVWGVILGVPAIGVGKIVAQAAWAIASRHSAEPA